MKILMIGEFSETAKSAIAAHFPKEWNVVIVPPGPDIQRHLEDCQVLIPEHVQVDSNLLAHAKKLRLVQTGAGFDNVDIPACTQLGIWAANASGVNAQAVAEHVLALILSYYKNIPFLDSFMRKRTNEEKLNYTGSELSGRTIGIIGWGAIGQKVAALCQAFDMKVLVYSRHAVQIEGGAERTDLDTLLSTSDMVSLHAALNPQTRHSINQTTFKKMKHTALLINTSRGQIVNEDDLIEALKVRDIAGACLDVFASEPLSPDSELRDLPHVILTPHTAGMPDGRKFHKKRYDFFIENIRRVENGKEPKSKLNQL
ncbi:phosphoglycerate dehydrogenase [Saccharibacillus sp. O16]|nr:phosphoglycerate dehydrogenase [Saccharibacillus sp. O16]